MVKKQQNKVLLLVRTVEESDGFIRDIQRIGKFGTVIIDRAPEGHIPGTSPVVESSSGRTSLREDSPRLLKGDAVFIHTY